MNTSVDTYSLNIIADYKPASAFYNMAIELSSNNLSQLSTIYSFAGLKENWDSYNAKSPNAAAVTKAVNFIVEEINRRKLEVFFTAPTADGDIVVEIKHNNCNIEVVFSGEVPDKIICTCNEELHAEQNLNETTFNSYLKWLFR